MCIVALHLQKTAIIEPSVMKDKIQDFFVQNKKRVIWAGIGLVVFLLFIGAVSRGGNGSNGVDVYTVDSRDVVEAVTFSGRVVTADRADLAFNRSGRVASLRVEKGQSVRAGQTLATLEMGTLYAQLEDARAALRIAESDAITTPDQQDTIVENAYQTLLSNDLQAYVVDSRDEATPPVVTGTYTGTDTGEYRLQMYESKAESGYGFTYSGLESGRSTVFVNAPGPLGTRGLYVQFDPTSNYFGTEWVIPVPNTRSATYSTVKAGYDQALAARERAVGVGETAVRVQAAIDQANARVRSVNAQIAEGVIRAPFDGIVGDIEIEVGESATSGVPVVAMVGSGTYEVHLNVPEIDIAKIRIGDEVQVTLDAYGDRVQWSGFISAIAASESYVDGVPVYDTTVELMSPDERIRSGMNAKAFVETDRIDNVLAIPAYFIEEDEIGSYVMRRTDDGEERVLIDLGARGSDGFVEVLRGVSRGDVIVTKI